MDFVSDATSIKLMGSVKSPPYARSPSFGAAPDDGRAYHALMERVLNLLVGIVNVFFWFDTKAGRATWKALVLALLILAPTWVLTHGIAFSRRGPAATLANTALGQVQETMVKKAARDTVDRMKILPASQP